MAGDKAKSSSKVEEKGWKQKASDWLESMTKSNAYSGAAAAERMKRNLNPEDAASSVPATPEPNSYRQYQHEREAGDPNALSMSYEEWKRL